MSTNLKSLGVSSSRETIAFREGDHLRSPYRRFPRTRRRRETLPSSASGAGAKCLLPPPPLLPRHWWFPGVACSRSSCVASSWANFAASIRSGGGPGVRARVHACARVCVHARTGGTRVARGGTGRAPLLPSRSKFAAPRWQQRWHDGRDGRTCVRARESCVRRRATACNATAPLRRGLSIGRDEGRRRPTTGRYKRGARPPPTGPPEPLRRRRGGPRSRAAKVAGRFARVYGATLHHGRGSAEARSSRESESAGNYITVIFLNGEIGADRRRVAPTPPTRITRPLSGLLPPFPAPRPSPFHLGRRWIIEW